MDGALVRKAQQGDHGAFAYSILSDAQLAQDETQSAPLTVWRELPKLRDPDRFGALAATSAHE